MLLTGLLGSCALKDEAKIDALAAKVVGALPEEWPEEEMISQFVERARPNPDQLAEIQILRVGLGHIPEINTATSFDSDTLYVLHTLYIGLSRQEPVSKTFLPALAKKWEVSEDQLTWTFTLRPDITWVFFNNKTNQVEKVLDRDGKTIFVTADDVRTNILRVLDPSSSSPHTFLLFDIVNAEEYHAATQGADTVGVEAVDAQTLVITLEKPMPALDAIAELPIMAAYPSWLDQNTYDYDRAPYHYGYGPYVLWKYGFNNTTVLVRNPFWKGSDAVPEPILDEIQIFHDPYQYAIEKFIEEELDVAPISFSDYMEINEDPQLKDALKQVDGRCGMYLMFKNIDEGSLSDVNNRLAVAYAIDKQALVDEVFLGAAKVLNQFALPNLRAADYADSVMGIPYDEKLAQAILNTELWPEDGSEKIQFHISTGILQKGLGEQVKKDIEDTLNRELQATAPSSGSYFESVKEQESSAMFYFMYCLDYADAHNLWDIWSADGFLNEYLGVTTEYDTYLSLLDQARQTSNAHTRKEIYRQLEVMMIEEQALVIPLVQFDVEWLVRPNVRGEILPLFQQFENWWIAKE